MSTAMNFFELDNEMRAWRRHLYENPGFGFEETQTAEFVTEKLRDFGFEIVKTRIGETDIVARLTLGLGKRQIALCSSMDCLRIHEKTNLPYALKNPGQMHPAVRIAEVLLVAWLRL